MESTKGIDKGVFWPSIIFAFALSIPLAVFPEAGKGVVDTRPTLIGLDSEIDRNRCF